MSTSTTADPTRPRPVEAFWAIASDGRVTLGLLGILALTLAAAAFFPQLPAGLEGTAAERWLATTQSNYRSLGPLLRAIGVFNVPGSFWLRGLLALLAYNLLLRLADHVIALRQAWRPAQTVPPLPARTISTDQEVDGSLADVLPQVQELLKRRYRSQVTEADATRALVYAERGRWGLIGLVLACIGPLLVLIGLVVNEAAGWQARELTLTPDTSLKLARAEGWQIALSGVAGEEQAAVAGIALAQEGNGVRSLRVGYRQPGNWGNLWVTLRATGPALTASATDASGRPLLLQALIVGGEISNTIHIPFRQTQTEQGFAVPARNLTFRAVSYPSLPEKGIKGPVILVEAYRGDEITPFNSALVEDTATLVVGDVTTRLRREHYAVVDSFYLPGLTAILPGVLLLLAGGILAVGWPRTEMWVSLAQRRRTVAIRWQAAPVGRGRREVRHLTDALTAWELD